jgi:prepilin-type N-terminal cleavage/methylation domain-containing protein
MDSKTATTSLSDTRSSQMRRRLAERAGFTLVELLVVIGIIGILVGILLPALSRARESANKAACLANLHQIGIYLQMYQNNFKGQIPVFVYGATAAVNYMAYVGNVNDYAGMGLMVPANIAPKDGSKSGAVFYCPTAKTVATSQQFDYRDPANPGGSNPWIGVPGQFTRTTYSMRPEYYSQDTPTTTIRPQFPYARWDMILTTASTNVRIIAAVSGRPCFPRANAFTRKSASALVMDLNSSKTNRAVVHRGGVNVLYANWGAKYVPAEYIKKWIDALEPLEAANAAPARKACFNMWNELDNY